jgi:hypothetical protein
MMANKAISSLRFRRNGLVWGLVRVNCVFANHRPCKHRSLGEHDAGAGGGVEEEAGIDAEAAREHGGGEVPRR